MFSYNKSKNLLSCLQKNFQKSSRREVFFAVEMGDILKLQEKGMAEKLQKTARENAEKKKPDLAKRIKEFEMNGKDEQEVKQQFYQEADQMVEDSINEALKSEGIKASLDDIRNDDMIKTGGKKELADLESKVAAGKEEAHQAVDQYFATKAAGQKAAGTSLQQVPPASSSAQTGTPEAPANPTTNPQDAQANSAPTANPQEAQAKRNQAIEANRAARTAQFNGIRAAVSSQKPAEIAQIDNTEARKTLAGIAKMVLPGNPSDQKPYSIPDYQGWSINWEENVNTKQDGNFDSPARAMLEGDLIGLQIAKGPSAVEQEMKAAFELYDKSDVGFWNVDRVFTTEHLNKDLGLKDYLVKAEQYNPASDKVKGAIASLLKVASGNREYESYITSQITNFKFTKNDPEENQLLKLMSLKSADKFKEALPDTRELTVRTIAQKAIEQNESFSFQDPDLLKFLQNQDATYAALDKSGKAVALERYNQQIGTEIKNFLQTQTAELKTQLTQKFDELKTENAKTSGVDAEKMAQLEAATQILLAQIDQISSQFNLQKPAEELVNGRVLANLQSLQTDTEAYTNDILPQNIQKAKQSPAPTPSSTDPATPEATAAQPDRYKTAWNNGAPEVPSKFSKLSTSQSSVDLTINSGDLSRNVRYRDGKGDVIGELVNGTKVILPDVSKQAKPVEDLNYIEVLVQDPQTKAWKSAWIAQEYLQPLNSVDQNPPPEIQKPVENSKPQEGLSSYASMFERVKQEVENNPNGATFDLPFNNKNLPCRAQKLPDGIHLFYANQYVVNGNLVFPNVQAMQDLVESGSFHQNLTMALLENPKFYEKYSSEDWVSDIKFVKKTGPYSLLINFDWKGPETVKNAGHNNPLVNLTIGEKGVIEAEIQRDHVGPNGENFRKITAPTIDELMAKLKQIKHWSENYEELSKVAEHEEKAKVSPDRYPNLFAQISEPSSYDEKQALIGHVYGFTSFIETGRASIRLSWDGTEKNESKQNPTLIVTITNRGTLNYIISNFSGSNGQQMGTYGEVNDFASLINTISEIKKNPTKYLQDAATHRPPW